MSPTNNVPIVFLPGIGVTCKNLEPQKQFLEKKGVKVICLDWPAFDRKNFNFSHHADWVINKLNELSIKKAGFLGQSRGGLALIKIASKYPEHVAFAIINSAPAGLGPKSISPWFYWLVKLLSHVPSIFLKFSIKLANEFSSNPYIPMLLTNNPKELVSCYLDHMDYDWSEDIKKITVPTVFRYGQKDEWVKRAGTQAVTTSNKQVVYDQNSGHVAPKPEELWDLIKKLHKTSSSKEILDLKC